MLVFSTFFAGNFYFGNSYGKGWLNGSG